MSQANNVNPISDFSGTNGNAARLIVRSTPNADGTRTESRALEQFGNVQVDNPTRLLGPATTTTSTPGFTVRTFERTSGALSSPPTFIPSGAIQAGNSGLPSSFFSPNRSFSIRTSPTTNADGTRTEPSSLAPLNTIQGTSSPISDFSGTNGNAARLIVRSTPNADGTRTESRALEQFGNVEVDNPTRLLGPATTTTSTPGFTVRTFERTSGALSSPPSNVQDDLLGQNVISGNNGDETLNGTEGSDIINAGDGRNRIFAGSGNDIITAGVGNDLIFAGAGDDSIFSGAGNDVIDASLGNNLIDAGTGFDRVTAGIGNDTFVLNAGVGSVEIRGFGSGDTFQVGAGLSSSDAISSRISGSDTIISSGNDVLARLSGVQLTDLNFA